MSDSTNGWDAVLALNAVAINHILFYDYAKEGPARQASQLRVLISGDEPDQNYALDLTLGPPLVDLTKDTVQMLVNDGQLAYIDSGGLRWIMPIERDSSLLGPLNFGDITGKDVVGQVTLDFAKGTFVPTLQGVDPNTTLPAQIGDAIKTYYQGASVQIRIGSVVTGNVPAALQPTEFKMYKQQQPNGSDSCLLFLIKTNGPSGSVSPLANYPLTADVSAALIISERTLLEIMEQIKLGQVNLQFTLHQDGGTWSIVGNQGQIPIAAYNQNSDTLKIIRTNGFTIGVNGFELKPGSDGSLNAAWSTTWTQNYDGWMGVRWRYWQHFQTDITLSFKLHATPTVNPDTCVVQFDGAPDTAMKAGNYDFPLGATYGYGLLLADALWFNFNSVQVPHVDTFALQNLVFPGEQRVHMNKVASFIDGLQLDGKVTVPLVITPREVTLSPGQKQQFCVEGSPPVSWEVKVVGGGTITSDGLYTPPSTVRRNQVVVIEAVSTKDTSQVGYAIALVTQAPPSGGLIITPGQLTLTTSTAVFLEVTDASGNPVDADVSLESGAPGQLTRGHKTGQWTYISPKNVVSPTRVRIHATHGTATGTATFEVRSSVDSITVTASPPSVVSGKSATITVTGLDEVFFAADQGTISENNDVVTYIAPSVSEDTYTNVLAYGTTDDGSAGAGSVQIKVTKA